MRGGIHKKGNNYYAVVYDGIDPGTGRKRRRWVPAGTRRADAERVLADLIRRKYDGEPVPTERLTVAQYLTERLLPVQKSRLRTSTYDSYRRNIDLHAVPALGRRPLAKVTLRTWTCSTQPCSPRDARRPAEHRVGSRPRRCGTST